MNSDNRLNIVQHQPIRCEIPTASTGAGDGYLRLGGGQQRCHEPQKAHQRVIRDQLIESEPSFEANIETAVVKEIGVAEATAKPVRPYFRFNQKDEYYTPPILVKPIIKYIKPNSTVWCPFDTSRSEFVLMLREAGFKVVHSHIWTGQDFFHYEPPHFDCIISNPPFSRKLEVMKRLYSFDKPFAILMGLPVLNYQEVGSFFVEKPLQLLIVDKKVSFDGKTTSFNTSYFCHRFLPKDIVFQHLEHNNTGRHFVASRMGRQSIAA